MKIITFILTLILVNSITILNGQSELVIEVTTDKYPEETKWVLYNTANEIVQERTMFNKEATHFDTIQLNSTSCYYWTIYDTYHDGMSATNPGDYKLYLDGSLIATCVDPNFGDSISVYGLGEVCASNDIGAINLAVLDYLSKDEEPIKVNVVNMGSEVINSIVLTYSVNDYISEEITIENLNINLSGSEIIIIPEKYTFTEAGVYTISVNITKVNDEVDTSDLNNSVSKEVTVVDGIVKKHMVEMVSSAYCGPCYDANIMVNGSLFAYPDTWTLTKYLLDWGDRKYVPGNDQRFDMYNIGGAPYLLVNGTQRNWTTFTKTTYSEYLGQISDVKLMLNAYIIGDSIYATVKVVPQVDINEVTYLRGVVVERFCHENLKSGAEYYHPSYGYLPNPEGIRIESMGAGEELTFTTSGNIKAYPLEPGSLTNMILNFYVQKEAGNEILQSESFNLNYTNLEPVLSFNIEDNSENVNINGLEIIMNSNRTLFNEDGNNITVIKNHFSLRIDEPTGVSVPFEASINDDYNKVTINATYNWTDYTKYVLIVKDFTLLGGVEIANDTLTFTTTDIISNVINNNIEVYPNPANEVLNINVTDKAAINIISSNGIIISDFDCKMGINSIDVSNLEQGLYFIELVTEKKRQQVKFLKQ